MAINTAETFYPRNDTTVDTGTGIDIRVLLSTQSDTNDVTQTATASNTEDNVERWFDPATAGNTDATNINTTLVKRGWALRLTEDMTTTDDTNCDAVLPAGTATVSLDVRVGWTGTPLQGTTITLKSSLWKYNPSTDTGSLIAAGTSATTTWNALTENNVFKTITVSITVPQTTFSTGEILMMQIGLNTGTLGNPLSGSITYTFTLRINNTTTKIAFASGQHLLQFCNFTNNLSGVGTPTRNGLAIIPTSYNLVALGVSAYTKLTTVAKTFTLNAIATASRTGLLSILLPRNLTALATSSYDRQVTAQRIVDLTARGEVINYSRALSIGRLATGIGTITYLKQVTASKSFDLTGLGTPDYSKFTIANREFNVIGQGKIVMAGPNASMISMPLDDVPDGGAAGPTYIFPVLD